jgi:hypothetical protein
MRFQHVGAEAAQSVWVEEEKGKLSSSPNVSKKSFEEFLESEAKNMTKMLEEKTTCVKG